MGEPGPTPTITLSDTLAVFESLDNRYTPLTATEVAEELGCTRRTAHRKLSELAEKGDLETKKVGANSRVYWRTLSGTGDEDAPPPAAEPAQFVEFVRTVEDYAIFTLDPEGHVATWNQGAEAIKGYSEPEILGEHYSTFYRRQAVAEGRPERNLELAAENGRYEERGWRVRKDGSTFYADVVITAIHDESGELKGFTKVTQDLTERREHEAELRQERDFTDRILEATPMSILVFEQDGSIVRMNERARDRLGLDESDDPSVGEREIYDEEGNLIPPEERPYVTAFETGEPVYDWQGQVDLPKGRVWMSVNVVPLGDLADPERVLVVANNITRQKEQAKQLQRDRDKLEAELNDIFDRVTDAVYALDDEWRFTYVNDRAEEIIQRNEGELLGESIWEEFPEAAEGTIWEKYHEAVETQSRVDFETYIEQLDLWVEVNVYPSETGVSVYFRDVSERVERERELERYETIVETVKEGVYTVDQKGRFSMVNDAYAEMVGYEREELLGEPVTMVVDEDTTRQVSKLEQELKQGERDAGTMEADLQTADGGTIRAAGTFSLLEDASDAYLRVGVVRDITERVERERALEESEQRYRTLAEHFPNGAVTLFDEDLRFTLAEGQIFDTTELEAEYMLGRTLQEVFETEVARKLEPACRGAFEGQTTSQEVEFGGREWALFTTPVRDDDGEVFAGMAMAQDISERKERERSLERQRNQLATLNTLNELVQEVSHLAIESASRDEIEELVCREFADSDLFQASGIGQVDAGHESVTMQTVVGPDGDLEHEDVTIDIDAVRESPITEAIRTGDVSVIRNEATGEAGPLEDRDAVQAAGMAGAVPIMYEGTNYGVLTVESNRADAFRLEEQTVMERLGVVIGHAINAIERKQALMSEELLEMSFEVPNVLDGAATGADYEPIRFERTISAGEDQFVQYGEVTHEGMDALRALVESVDRYGAVTIYDETAAESRFELRLSEPPVISEIAALGGRIDRFALEDGTFAITVHLPQGADARRVTNVVTETYPNTELVTKRQVTRSTQQPEEFTHLLEKELTEKQRSALEAAYFAGFFNWPRDNSGESVADSLDVSASTFHHHVRAAERKILGAVIDA